MNRKTILMIALALGIIDGIGVSFFGSVPFLGSFVTSLGNSTLEIAQGLAIFFALR